MAPQDRRSIVEDIVAYRDPKSGLQAADLVTYYARMDWGMSDANPIDHVRFYSKHDPNRGFPITKQQVRPLVAPKPVGSHAWQRALIVCAARQRDQVGRLVPENFSEHTLRLYVRTPSSEKLAAAAKCFREWCEKKHGTLPRSGLSAAPRDSPGHTPYAQRLDRMANQPVTMPPRSLHFPLSASDAKASGAASTPAQTAAPDSSDDTALPA